MLKKRNHPNPLQHQPIYERNRRIRLNNSSLSNVRIIPWYSREFRQELPRRNKRILRLNNRTFK